jgi:hypothetical protein
MAAEVNSLWCGVPEIRHIGQGFSGAPKTLRQTHPSDGYLPAGFGPEAPVLWGPTRNKAGRFSTRRQAAEGNH